VLSWSAMWRLAGKEDGSAAIIFPAIKK